MNPRMELRVKELQPLLPDMENQRAAQEKVLQPEAGGHTPEIKEVPAQPTLCHSLSTHYGNTLWQSDLYYISGILYLVVAS